MDMIAIMIVVIPTERYVEAFKNIPARAGKRHGERSVEDFKNISARAGKRLGQRHRS
jgi:hypothetical protein